jgi:predicted phage terminase large subunit-like protein
LIEWIADTCKRYKVTRLLIEDKARGYDVAAEINRLYTREKWAVELVDPVGDKVSRGHAVVPCFTDGAVWAPFLKGYPVKWAEDVIKNCEVFPKATHDDLYDTVTQSLNWARVRGLILRGDEVSAALDDEAVYKPKLPSVAEQYGV